MSVISLPCDNCKHYLGSGDDYVMRCKAAPDGIKKLFNPLKEDPRERSECKNGYKYEEK